MLSASKTNLEIPMYNKSNSTSASAFRKRKMEMEIPVWAKATVPNDLGNYVAVMPLHQREAAQYFASQRKAPCRWSPRSGTWCQTPDADLAPCPNSSDEAESTRASDSMSTEGNNVPAQIDAAVEPTALTASKTQVLVAELREARLAAQARRVSFRWANIAHRFLVAKEQEVFASMKAKALEQKKYLKDCASHASKGCAEEVCQASAAICKQEVPFSVTVGTLDGAQYQIENLCDNMVLSGFYKKVAKHFEIPGFAVKLLLDGRVLDLSHEHNSLHAAGLKEGSELMLVKTLGAARPDLRQLGEFEKQWRGA